jgi:hypothetical protein
VHARSKLPGAECWQLKVLAAYYYSKHAGAKYVKVTEPDTLIAGKPAWCVLE